MKPQSNLLQAHLAQQVNGKDLLKSELAASHMCKEQSEYDVKLKATVAATEAANILKQTEHQVYNQYASK